MKREIELFFAQKRVGFVGVSRNPKKFGNTVYAKLKESGYEVYPIHPEAKSLDGVPCVATVRQLPEDVGALMVIARPDVCASVLRDLPGSITRVWAFSGMGTHANVEAEIKRLRNSGVSVISGFCPCMFIEPVGSIHALHRFLARLLGKYPNPHYSRGA